jgi:ribosome-binding protein aMBF1 (putative translation factor)
MTEAKRFDQAKIAAVVRAARSLDFAMVDCWGQDADPEQSWDAPARLVARLRSSLDALSADGGSTNEARRARAVARRTAQLRAKEAREKRLDRSVRKHVLARRHDTIRALEERGLAWTDGRRPNLIEVRATGAQLRGVPPRNQAAAYTRAALGDDLRIARERAGLTRPELAARLSTRSEMLRRLEAGHTSHPEGEEFVGRWLRACGLPPTWNARRQGS